MNVVTVGVLMKVSTALTTIHAEITPTVKATVLFLHIRVSIASRAIIGPPAKLAVR